MATNEEFEKILKEKIDGMTGESFAKYEKEFGVKINKENLSNFMNHFDKNCDDKDCPIEKKISEKESEAFALGFLVNQL